MTIIYLTCINYTRHTAKTNKTHTTHYVLDTTLHTTQDEDKQNKIQHNILDTTMGKQTQVM
jgi:hypothetical protein